MSILKHDPSFDGTGYGLEITMLAKRLAGEDWQRVRMDLANVISAELREKDAEIAELKKLFEHKDAELERMREESKSPKDPEMFVCKDCKTERTWYPVCGTCVDKMKSELARLREALKCVVDNFDLPKSEYSQLERMAIEKAKQALASGGGEEGKQ